MITSLTLTYTPTDSFSLWLILSFSQEMSGLSGLVVVCSYLPCIYGARGCPVSGRRQVGEVAGRGELALY
jgi:hypothetical protein